jgi:hypothetical protein
MRMRARWPTSWRFFRRLFAGTSSGARHKQDAQAAPEFLFKQSASAPQCDDRTPGQPRQPGIRLVAPGQPPYRRVRREEFAISRTEVPALTIAANASQGVEITGNGREDWSLRFCAYGDGNSEGEARDRLRGVSLVRLGATVSLNGPGICRGPRAGGNLIVQAPADAPITVHASFAPVSVRNMGGPVRVTAIHARATLLDTTGKVDATAFVVDFAGSEGTVVLSAEAEINLKLTSLNFKGTLIAWAQLPVRVLVPAAFQTPFQAVVSRPQDFVCRTEFAANMKLERNGGLYVFTYPGDGSRPPEDVHLRSEHAAVVVDTGQ